MSEGEIEKNIERKVARPDYPVLDVIKRRWSPRAFADRDVEPEKLRSLLEAARWAPSSFNEQPWRFILARRSEEESYERLLQCLNEKNQRWAQHAPVLMLTAARRRFSHSGRENRHAWHDVGLAMGSLLAQATELDLYVHQIAGIRPERAREAFGIPEAFEPVVGVAVGYVGEPAMLSEKRRKQEVRERRRRPLNETVFSGSWGEPSPLFEHVS